MVAKPDDDKSFQGVVAEVGNCMLTTCLKALLNPRFGTTSRPISTLRFVARPRLLGLRCSCIRVTIRNGYDLRPS